MQGQGQRKENMQSNCMQDILYMCIMLKLHWKRYYEKKNLENWAKNLRSNHQVLIIGWFHFLSLNSYTIISLQKRSTAWYVSVGQTPKSIYLGYFRAIINNLSLCTHINVLWLRWKGTKFQLYFYPSNLERDLSECKARGFWWCVWPFCSTTFTPENQEKESHGWLFCFNVDMCKFQYIIVGLCDEEVEHWQVWVWFL